MLSPGDRVRDYEVIAPLGSGGMATLYLARRRGVGGFSRLVTLKLVHPHLMADERIIKLFLDEARISAHVVHPNVVHVEEVGRYNGSYFIAMEYVHGVSLAELLQRMAERRLRLRPVLCVWLAAQVAEALHAAHEASSDDGVPLGIVHRDVSPQNVLIGHTGHVKLIDFGIAKSQIARDRGSAKHQLLGKLRYMSPEQLQLQRADRRSDVYALGVILWEMLTGRSFLRCQRVDDDRDWATREHPRPPSRHSSYTTAPLDRVVLKSIACNTTQRYDNAFQFRAALLRAYPSVVKVDAPMVAALMRSIFGEDLDRRRASWPSEVAVELDAVTEATTLQNWSLDAFTAEYPGPNAAGEADDPPSQPRVRYDDEPTRTVITDAPESAPLALTNISSESAPEPQLRPELRDAGEAGRSAGDTVSSRALRTDTQLGRTSSAASTRVLQSALDTLKVLPVWSAGLFDGPAGERAAAVGSACLLFGFIVGALLAPGRRPQAAPPPAAARAVIECSAIADVDTKMLTETRHVSSAPPDAPPQDAGRVLADTNARDTRSRASERVPKARAARPQPAAARDTSQHASPHRAPARVSKPRPRLRSPRRGNIASRREPARRPGNAG